jgi:glycosyltransferase involved in cell wall biosynthesis
MTDKRIRVLLCSSSMDGGGSERQLLYLLQGLDRSKFEPLLYLLYETGVLLSEVPEDVKRFSFWSDTAFPKLNWPGRIHRMQVRHLERVLRENRIDVTYDRLFHMTLVTGPATAKTNTPRVSTIVSPPQYDLVKAEPNWRTLKWVKLRKAYQTAQAVLTVGQGTADNAAAYYRLPSSRFQVMLSPIDIERIDRESSVGLTGIVLRPNRKHIVSVGRLSDEKGHRYLIQAFAKYNQFVNLERVPAADLHLVGEGVLRKELQSLVNNLGIAESVYFHGQVSSPFALLKQCDLMCLPSLYEGMPNALLEAMACRVPVLATNTAQGAGELFRANPLGTLVQKANVDEIANAIRDRFENPAPWLARLEAARDYVESKHSMKSWIANVAHVLESVTRR